MGFGKDGKGVIVREQMDITLAALAAQDYVQNNGGPVMDQDFRILKTELTATLTEITSLEGAGLILYMTEGELDAATVEATIETNGPVSGGDRSEIEAANRWVRMVATSPNDTVNNTERMMLNKEGGSMLTINPRWTFRRRRTGVEGGWNWGIYNNGVLLTTGATCRILATHYGVWVG